MSIPVVSICCEAFNHAKYIRDALEGFLMQRTNFPFEVLIHDDASTDGTADIIREYEAKYPDIIKPIYQTVNQYSQGKSIWCEFQFPRAQGKYIALCEGDDFWTDPRKLQIQYDFMESHPDYSLCMHGRYILDHLRKRFLKVKNSEVDCDVAKFVDKMVSGEWCVFTQTMFFSKKNLLQKMPDIIEDCKNAPMGDFQLAFHLALMGKVRTMSRCMAAYRISANSVMRHTEEEKSSFAVLHSAAVQRILVRNGMAEKVDTFIRSNQEMVIVPHKKSFLQWLRSLHWELKKRYGYFCYILEQIHHARLYRKKKIG